MKISICIPTWEQHGKGPEFLINLFDSIKLQTFKEFDVILSDQSLNDEIKKISQDYESFFPIRYYRNEFDRGKGPANTNNSLKKADGEIIKIMFQDDLFFDPNALRKIYKRFQNNSVNWIVTGTNHTYDDGKSFTRDMVPYWNDRIIYGVNTISSPSVLAFRNNQKIYFDENLVLLMDCDMYHQLFVRYGLPTIIEDILVTNRFHSKQISFQYTNDVQIEIDYVRKKYGLTH